MITGDLIESNFPTITPLTLIEQVARLMRENRTSDREFLGVVRLAAVKNMSHEEVSVA